jgi:hypothetical protein
MPKQTTKSSQPVAFGEQPTPAYQTPQKPDFELWWAPIAKKFALKAPVKQAVVLHMKSAGFWETKDWNKGMKHFGYKID